MKLWYRHRQAGDEQYPTGVLHLNGFESRSSVNKKYQTKWQVSVKQFQSRQVILPGLFLHILLSHDKITHMDR